MSQNHYATYMEDSSGAPNLFSLGRVPEDAKNMNPATMLGHDISAIRERVLGKRPTNKISSSEHKALYADLQKNLEIDLNEEENLAPLEDPVLIAHMNSARAQLIQYQKTLSRLPRRETLRTQHLDSMGAMSRQLREFDEFNMYYQEQIEHSHRLARIINDLTRQKPIHGLNIILPKEIATNPAVVEAFTFLYKKALASAKMFEGAISRVAEIKRNIFSIRHTFEESGDGLLRLIESAEEGRRRYQEYNKILSSRLKELADKKPNSDADS